MKWKFIFNGMKATCNRDGALKRAKEAGYFFFFFNGRVYTVNGEDTGILEDDLI